MILNIYKSIPGKPMIYSLDSAREFMRQTKHPFYIRNKASYIKICGLKVGLYERVDEWTEFQLWEITGTDAVKWVYQNRKHINERFRDE